MSTRMALALVLLTLGLVGCNNDGALQGTYDLRVGPGTAPQPLDFEGFWTVDYDCGPDGTGQFTVTITVEADGVTASGDGFEGGIPFDFQGTISGNTLTWTRNYANNPGDGGWQQTSYTLTSATEFDKDSLARDQNGDIAWECDGKGTK